MVDINAFTKLSKDPTVTVKEVIRNILQKALNLGVIYKVEYTVLNNIRLPCTFIIILKCIRSSKDFWEDSIDSIMYDLDGFIEVFPSPSTRITLHCLGFWTFVRNIITLQIDSCLWVSLDVSSSCIKHQYRLQVVQHFLSHVIILRTLI